MATSEVATAMTFFLRSSKVPCSAFVMSVLLVPPAASSRNRREREKNMMGWEEMEKERGNER